MAITGHTDRVTCVAFNPDAVRIISGSRDSALKLWGISDGQCLTTFKSHRGWVRSVAFGPEGLTAVSVDGISLKLWYAGKAAAP